jgi:hypothetical protein
MHLNFSGTKVPVEVKTESSFSSKHTGSSLRRLQVETTIRGQNSNEMFLSLIAKAKTEGVTFVDEDGNPIGKWKIGNTSWSHTDGTRIYYHTLDIEEIEELSLDRLVVGELTIHPYAYEERFEQDTLRIEAKALLSEAQYAELKSMLQSSDYFQVVRHGINEQPVEMQFTLGYWSKHDEGIKHELNLYEKKVDERPDRLRAAFQWIRSMSNQVAENKVCIDALLSTLADKGVLTTEEIEQIHADAIERRWDAKDEFFRVEDLDDLL